MTTFALVTPGGSALGLFDLEASESEPGAVIRREGQPDRRVVGLLANEDAGEFGGHDALIVERV